MEKKKKNFPAGISLFEAVVYIAFFVVIVGVVMTLTTQLIAINQSAQQTNEVTSSARYALDTMAQEVRHAKSVYTPTSSFDVSPGQLSLETTRDLVGNETTTYVDFYVDSGLLYLKREGSNSEQLTSDSVKVEALTFSYLNQSTVTPAVRMTLTIGSNDKGTDVNHRSITLVTTATMRSYAE
ncbi:hypothetical protein COV04_00500 [Candidatus Uhrbacteria bacterium CG10_big_fil_rev_8_21_14_0_10_48_11]|uniref:Type II secretion system protein n=1 Tax=Candidatus Uhrbacteria bacterium CG10_big_fil_rev_8_21_14_0_10_48_11 TaxID=1975037 RepID=A0A2M8LFJ6_9BACT|nr:MAG: hypothetical protein COV04_00500 [Candidatus Uhrbacteria bacterium CG10_big_fil_rev_8_21_14_0_10_48_11]